MLLRWSDQFHISYHNIQGERCYISKLVLVQQNSKDHFSDNWQWQYLVMSSWAEICYCLKNWMSHCNKRIGIGGWRLVKIFYKYLFRCESFQFHLTALSLHYFLTLINRVHKFMSRLGTFQTLILCLLSNFRLFGWWSDAVEEGFYSYVPISY